MLDQQRTVKNKRQTLILNSSGVLLLQPQGLYFFQTIESYRHQFCTALSYGIGTSSFLFSAEQHPVLLQLWAEIRACESGWRQKHNLHRFHLPCGYIRE